MQGYNTQAVCNENQIVVVVEINADRARSVPLTASSPAPGLPQSLEKPEGDLTPPRLRPPPNSDPLRSSSRLSEEADVDLALDVGPLLRLA